MELQVSEIQALQPITFNYEELKKSLVEKVETYRNLIYSEENINIAKKDRANLNKLAKAIDDERKRIKSVLLMPYEDFEIKCKELVGIVSDATNNIDSQIKTFELKKDEEKRSMIKDIFDSYIGEFKELINFDTVFNEKWLNTTYTYKKIEEEINHIITNTKSNMLVLDGQIQDENIKRQIKDFYFKNINEPTVLTMSLMEVKRIEEANSKLETLENSKIDNENFEKIDANVEEKIIIFDIRVTATRNQIDLLKKFLVKNQIKVEKVPENRK